MEPSEETISSRKEKLNSQITGKALDGNKKPSLINRECLLDTLQALYDECSIESLQKYDKNIAQFVDRYKCTISELKRLRVNVTDFEIKDVIGRGHFGEVHVVKEKQTGDIYAMKTLRKCDSLEKTSFDIERDIMAFAHSPWITSLHYAFQDSVYLFFVMEYHPGGDLLALLYRQGGTLPESAATFYLAELILALEDLHAMGFVHRDIKPDNILLDRCGHLKLVDFGSSAKLNSEGFVDKGMPVGTPDYVAPEVLQSVEAKNSRNSGYGVSCDYWSLGILAYELTVGKPPFSGQNTTAIYSKIMNHTNNLKFPPDVLLTQAYISFLKGLIVDVKSRLNHQQIKQHVLFKNLHFDSLRDQVPPYVPKISSADDTSNFTEVTTEKAGPSIENFKKKTQFSGRNLPFIGFTFTHSFTSHDKQFKRSSVAKDEIIKSMREEIGNMRKDLIKREDFEEVKLCLEKKVLEKSQKLENVETIRSKLERDLAASIAESTALKRTLEIERKDRAELEKKALDLIKSAKIKWETSERTKVENLKLEIEQQKNKISQLVTTNNMLNEQLQRAFRTEDKHKQSLETVEKLSRRSVIGLESRLEKVALDSKNQLKNMQVSLDETVNQKNMLQFEIKKLQNNEKNLLNELEKSRNELLTLKSQTCETENLVKQLSQKVTELESDIENYSNLKEKVSELTQELNSSYEMVKDLEKKNLLLESKSQCIEEYKIEINSLRTIKSQNEKRINELENKLRGEEEKCSSLSKQLQDSETLVNESQQLKEIRVKMWKMEKELNNCKIDKRIVERELKEAENRVKELDEEINRLNRIIDENKKIHESAMIELSGFNENLSLDLVKLRESYKNLEDKLENEKTKYEVEKDVIIQLKNVIKEKDSTISEIISKNDLLKNDVISLQNSCKLAEDEKNRVIEDFKNIKSENCRLNRELEDVKKQLDNTYMNLEALREACMIIENQVIEYEKLNASMESEKSSLLENTEKLIKDLCKAKEDIQEARKLANEEKSARLLCETKIKRLKEDIECLENECKSYKEQSLKYRECSNNLSEELTVSEEKVSDLVVTVRSYERQIEEFISENNSLKEDISQYLTQMAGLKESNSKYKQQVHDLKNTENIYMQRIVELEDILNAKVNYYEERELKNSSTIKQQAKLIDYLQIKIDEHSHKKRTLTDKLFGHSKKENQPPISLPINYKDLEEQLQKQKTTNKELQNEIYKLKAELNCRSKSEVMKATKLERHKSEIVSPQTKYAIEQLRKSPVASKSELYPTNSAQRMYHNIPHRFVTKLSKRLTKCDHCSNQIMLGRDVSVCSECNVFVHPDCASSLKGTCGLPQAYAKHFRDSLSKLNLNIESKEQSMVPLNVEGWIKVLSKNDSWEKRYAFLTDSHLNIYTNSLKENGVLVQSVDLKIPNSKKKIVLEPVPSEIGVNIANSDIPFVLKVEISTDSTCWPPVSVVLMALSLEDRDKWFKALQKLCIEDSDKYHIDSIMTVPDHLYVNCVLELTSNIKVLGTNQGLYSYYNDLLLFIEGLSEVHNICILADVNVVVMIAGGNSGLVVCDLNHLINLTQCAPCTKPVLTFTNVSIKNLDGFHFLETSNMAKHQMLCTATSKQLVIAKFDLDINNFVPLRIMDTAEPVGCILFTEHTLIVGADKFFEIDLSTFKAEEFLDSSDLRLKHVIKCHKMRSFPLAILQIFNDPKEYLLCFNEFSVFVDEYGRCSRATEIKSSYLPIGFQFIRPYLYIIDFSGVEIIKLTEDVLKSSDCDGVPRINIDLKKMRYLGRNKQGLYVLHDNKIKLLEGKKLVSSDDASSVVSQSVTDVSSESDRFSFTSSIVQSLDGNLSDAESSSITEDTCNRKVKFSSINL